MLTPDELFLRTVQDLQQRSTSTDEYELLIAAALLRKLLLDSNPLVDQVNRTRRLPITFRIAMRGPAPSGGDAPPILWVLDSGLDPTSSGGSSFKIADVDRSRFLKRPVSLYMSEEATVHDLIDYFAHVRGAVHSAAPSKAGDLALKELEAHPWTHGVPLPMEILRSIIRVVLRAMNPLVEDIRGKADHA